MPIYEYECLKCENHFEEFKSILDSNDAPCPKCKSAEVKKLVSLSGFSLNGGGWYKDGYGSSSKPTTTSAAPTATSPIKNETKTQKVKESSS